MTQLQLYVPEKVAVRIRENAKKKGLGLSRYLAEIVRKEVKEGWPEGFFEEVVGGWKGDSRTRPPQGEFGAREKM
jgi:hypothetical protein